MIDSTLNVAINTFRATNLQAGANYRVFVSSVNGQNRSSEAIDLEIVTGPLSPNLTIFTGCFVGWRMIVENTAHTSAYNWFNDFLSGISKVFKI